MDRGNSPIDFSSYWIHRPIGSGGFKWYRDDLFYWEVERQGFASGGGDSPGFFDPVEACIDDRAGGFFRIYSNGNRHGNRRGSTEALGYRGHRRYSFLDRSDLVRSSCLI